MNKNLRTKRFYEDRGETVRNLDDVTHPLLVDQPWNRVDYQDLNPRRVKGWLGILLNELKA